MLRPKLNRIWTSTNSALRRDPGDAKYLQGWVSEIPTFQVLNYLQYKVDTTLLALAERGIFEWGTDITYGLGSVVWDETDKKIYVATVGAPNKTTKPSSNPTQWAASSIQVSRASYEAIVAAINAHIADITSNPHKITAGMINAYNKNEIDNINSTYRALVLNHASDTNNPHKLTAAGVGAVPVTGGTYTGDVTFNQGIFFDAGKVNKLSKTNGLYLQAGTAILGVTDAGVAVAGTTTTSSPIVTESSFPTLKAAQEPKYAVPVPDFQMDMNNSIDLRYGAGTVDSGNWNPVFDPNDCALSFDNTLPTQVVSGGQLTVMTSGTIACDMILGGTQNTDTGHIVMFGNTAQNFYIDGRNVLALRTGQTPATGTYTMPDTTSWHRIVMTFGDGFVTAYVDGVQVRKFAVTGTPNPSSNLRLEGQGKSDPTLRRGGRCRNGRIWYNQILTPEQISTL